MHYWDLRIPEDWGGLDAESTLNPCWSRRRRGLCPGLGPLHDAVWAPGRWRRLAKMGRFSLRGCATIARRLAGDKAEVESAPGHVLAASTHRNGNSLL